MKSMTIGVIGCGNMGSAIVKGIVDKKILSSDTIFLYDKDPKKSQELAKETGVHQGDLLQIVRGSGVIIIAVKPQDYEELFKTITGDIVGQTLVSVMAGVRIETIEGYMSNKNPVVRAMPNMGAFASESMTCIAFNDQVALSKEIKEIFSGIGKVIEVDESLLDSVTSISGSGPAYLFYLAGAMIEAAEETGMEKKLAERLVLQTLYGSSLLLNTAGESTCELINKVASKGGTTEAALNVFEEQKMKETIKNAIKAAKQRSEQLAKGEK
jgi:pyrroline-5-carboxylate reductase